MFYKHNISFNKPFLEWARTVYREMNKYQERISFAFYLFFQFQPLMLLSTTLNLISIQSSGLESYTVNERK